MPAYQSRMSRTERRRKLMEELLGQAMQPEQTQMVSGRAVPYSPLQGLSKIAQAMLARKGIDAADAEQAAIEKELEEKKRQEQNQVIKILLGRKEQQAEPQTGGPLRLAPEGKVPYRDVPPYSPDQPPNNYGGQIAQDAMSGNLLNSNYQAFSPGKEYQPSLEADPTKAALYAATSPYLQGTGVERVAMAMMKNQQGSQRSPYYTFLPTAQGYATGNARTGEITMPDGTVVRSTDDPVLQGQLASAKKTGTGQAEKALDEPKRSSEIAAATEKTENLDSLIDQAKGQSSVWTTGLLGQTMKGIGGTPAHDLANTLNTVKANIGFDKLQEMRANSPTGGALGQVSEMENKLLQQVWSSVEQSQTQEQLKNNLERVRDQVKKSWKRIYDAYEKDYGKPYDGPKPEIDGVSTDDTGEDEEKNIDDLVNKYANP